MISFEYFPTENASSQIASLALRHQYYVQHTSDHGHLVVGMLQQDRPSRNGQWSEVNSVRYDLEARYFVQYTSFNTLVPGSLIQAEDQPQGQWKEIKTFKSEQFYNILIYDDRYEVWDFTSGTALDYTTNAEFVSQKMIPALEAIWPGITDNEIEAELYYFQGEFAGIDNDPAKLTPFSAEDAIFYNTISDGTKTTTNIISTDTSGPEIVFSVIQEAPVGRFCFVLKIHRTVKGKPVTDYVVLDNVFRKYLAG